MRQYKDFKKRAGQAKKNIQRALNEEADESLQSLVEMLEQFKVTDPTPEEKRKKDEELEKWFVSQKTKFWIIACISFLLGGAVMQQFADVVNADTTHVGRTGKYVPTKLATHYKRIVPFWQYANPRNFSHRLPADRTGDESQPCGADETKSGDPVGKWPTCLQRCLDQGECALEEDYNLDCFPTCPQITLSGAQDARFYIKRYSSSNTNGYFKQQIEIIENQEDIKKWETHTKNLKHSLQVI